MSAPNRTAGFFGELYLRSTRPFLSDEVTDQEVRYLAAALGRLGVAPPSPVVDLGAGHGRHAGPLRQQGWNVWGVEQDQRSLLPHERTPAYRAVRADFYRLPFRSGSLGGAYAWYASLFTTSDDAHRCLLEEVARVLRPGAGLILQTTSFERLAEAPKAAFVRTLPDGTLIEESSLFDVHTGWDSGVRSIHFPDGRRLSAQYFIRYYRQQELEELLKWAGFRVRWIEGGLSGEPFDERSAELILGAERHG